jgi:hypothetical protein
LKFQNVQLVKTCCCQRSRGRRRKIKKEGREEVVEGEKGGQREIFAPNILNDYGLFIQPRFIAHLLYAHILLSTESTRWTRQSPSH